MAGIRRRGKENERAERREERRGEKEREADEEGIPGNGGEAGRAEVRAGVWRLVELVEVKEGLSKTCPGYKKSPMEPCRR